MAGDGPERAALETLVQELGVEDSVTFLGWVEPEATPRLLDEVSVVLLPARWREPFCLVALEAAHRARPVVAARVGALPEVVVDGVTGLLTEPEEPVALARAVTTLLADPERAERLGQAARERAPRLFGWTRLLDEYEALYRRLTARPGMVSVVIPVFNAGPYVGDAVRSSAGADRVRPSGVIAVDDGSTDASAAAVRDLARSS